MYDPQSTSSVRVVTRLSTRVEIVIDAVITPPPSAPAPHAQLIFPRPRKISHPACSPTRVHDAQTTQPILPSLSAANSVLCVYCCACARAFACVRVCVCGLCTCVCVCACVRVCACSCVRVAACVCARALVMCVYEGGLLMVCV